MPLYKHKMVNSLTTKFFQKKKKCMQKKIKKKNHDPEVDSNPQPRVLEFNALPTWPLHYIAKIKNYKSFITNLTKKSWWPF